jgi:hypothetical protein
MKQNQPIAVRAALAGTDGLAFPAFTAPWIFFL